MAQHSIPDSDTLRRVEGYLQEENAVRISYRATGETNRHELVRHFPNVPSETDVFQKAVRLLRERGSVKNPTASRIVKDPMADKETYPGTWRVVSVDGTVERRGAFGPIETLRQGYADQLYWDEAYIDGGNSAYGSEHYRLILFPGINPSKEKDITDSLYSTGTLSDQEVGGETLAGTWDVLLVRPRMEEEAITLAVLVADPDYIKTFKRFKNTHREITVVKAWSIPKRIVDSTVSTYSSNDGTDYSQASYSPSQALVDITFRYASGTKWELKAFQVEWKNLTRKTYDFYYLGLTKAEVIAFDLAANVPDTYKTAGVLNEGYIWSTPRVLEAGYHRYDIIVTMREPVEMLVSERTVVEGPTTLVERSDFFESDAEPDVNWAGEANNDRKTVTVRAQKDNYGKWNGYREVRTEKPYNDGTAITYDVIYYRSRWTEPTFTTGYHNGVWTKRISSVSVYCWERSYSVKYCDTHIAATSHIAGTHAGGGIWPRGNLWLAIKTTDSAHFLYTTAA